MPTSLAPGSQVHCPGLHPSLNSSRAKSLPPIFAHTLPPTPPSPPPQGRASACLNYLERKRHRQMDRRHITSLAAPAPLLLNCSEVGLRLPLQPGSYFGEALGLISLLPHPHPYPYQKTTNLQLQPGVGTQSRSRPGPAPEELTLYRRNRCSQRQRQPGPSGLPS